MKLFLVALFALASSSAHASIYMYKPALKDNLNADAAWTVSWYADQGENAATTPLAADFGRSFVGLYTGTPTSQSMVQHLGDVEDPVATDGLRVTIDPAVGPNSDVYFIRIQSYEAVDSTGTPLIAFSSRFTLRRMTGATFAAAPLPAGAGAAAASNPAGPVASSASLVTRITAAAATSASTASAPASDRLQLVSSSAASVSVSNGEASPTASGASSNSTPSSSPSPSSTTNGARSLSFKSVFGRAGATLALSAVVVIALA